jgi:tRNA (mo5U34)-methyltransferase
VTSSWACGRRRGPPVDAALIARYPPRTRNRPGVGVRRGVVWFGDMLGPMASVGARRQGVDDRTARARRAVGDNAAPWYHTIELAPEVVTPGLVDLRKIPDRILPPDLSGLRAVDVATCDGFWAFELERRGAEVVAIDVASVEQMDVLPNRRAQLTRRLAAFEKDLGGRFQLATEVLGSRAHRVGCSVYDLAPDAVGGPADVAFIGALLLHLRDAVGALERVLETLAPGGRVFALEPISMRDTIRSPRRPVARFQPLTTEWNWWYPNFAALWAQFTTAGFEDVRRRGFHRPPSVKVMRQWYAGIVARRPR